MTRKMLPEERKLRKWVDHIFFKEHKSEFRDDITALVRAVREDERGMCAERGFAEYIRMFGDSSQNINRAGMIAAAIRRDKP